MEREEIALLRVQGHSMQEIGRRLRRAASTLSCGLRRNAATRSGGLAYRATTAQWHADRSARRPKPTKLALNPALRTYVLGLAHVCGEEACRRCLGPERRSRSWSRSSVEGPPAWSAKGSAMGFRAWSPKQIARRLPIDFPDDKTMRTSHEAISQALCVQGRGVLHRERTACLRTGRVLRVPRARVHR